MEKRYNIEYSPLAVSDLDGIGGYIVDTFKTPQTAEKLLGKIRQDIESLQDFPFLGRETSRETADGCPYRWLQVENYMVFYTVDEGAETLTVMRVLFGASDYLSVL